MLRLICLSLAVSMAYALLSTKSITTEDLDETVTIPCQKQKWIDSAYFFLSEDGFENPGCDFYMDLDLREAVANFCEDVEGACEFQISDILEKDADPECVSSFFVSYACPKD